MTTRKAVIGGEQRDIIMASTMRSVDTRFWIDGWVRKLNPLDRYVFLYFLTNDHSTWCGVYELPLETIAHETGIKERDLEEAIFPRLSPKMVFMGGWVCIPNWVKYHVSETGNMSPQQKKGFVESFNKVPEQIRRRIKELLKDDIPYTYPIGGVSALTLTLTSTFNTVANAPASPHMIKHNESRHSTDDEPVIDSETGEFQKKPEDPSYTELMSFWQSEIGVKFMNRSKQYKAIKTMRANGFSDEQIKERALLMNNETFYREHGFDFMSVLSDFSKRKYNTAPSSITIR